MRFNLNQKCLRFIFLILILFTSCYDEDVIHSQKTADASANPRTAASTLSTDSYFRGSMDNVTIATVNSKLVLNGWDLLKSHPSIEALELNNIGGTSYAYQQIRTDPLNSSRRAMYATILNDDPNVSGTTRAQMTIRFKDGVNLPVYHTSHRMYLGSDIGYLKNYSSAIYWFELFEIWNKRISGMDGSGSGSARWGLYLNKASGAGQPLYWVMQSEYMQPASRELDDIWKYTNKQVPIPLGKWVTLDLYMKRGQGTNGKLIITLTPDGGSPQVLFNITNTTVYPGRPEIQLKSWQPFKLYLDDRLLDWMKANGKRIAAYYNDFTWYKN
jgi:hypothetical protein